MLTLVHHNSSDFSSLSATTLRRPWPKRHQEKKCKTQTSASSSAICLGFLSFILPWAWPKEVHGHEAVFWFHLDCPQFPEDWAVTQPAEIVPICHTKNKNEIKCTFSSSGSFLFTLLLFNFIFLISSYIMRCFFSCRDGSYLNWNLTSLL